MTHPQPPDNTERSNSTERTHPEYMRVKSAPPQSTDKPRPVFRLCTLDGKPIVAPAAPKTPQSPSGSSGDYWEDARDSASLGNETAASAHARTTPEKTRTESLKPVESKIPSPKNERHAKPQTPPHSEIPTGAPVSIRKSHDKPPTTHPPASPPRTASHSPILSINENPLNTHSEHPVEPKQVQDSPRTTTPTPPAGTSEPSAPTHPTASPNIYTPPTALPPTSTPCAARPDSGAEVLYIPRDASKEPPHGPEELSEFEKFLLIEALIKQFPPAAPLDIKNIIATVTAIKERTPVPLNFILPPRDNEIIDKLKAQRLKEDSPIECVRNEFNRATPASVAQVIEKLQKTSIATIAEMQEIAGFVLEKAVTESLYLPLYTTIVGELKRTWRCEEEKSMQDKKQTCFFGTLMRYLCTRLDARHTWGIPTDERKIEAASRAELEQKLEEAETKRLGLKKKALGAIEFLAMLYVQNVVGPTHLLAVCDALRKTDSPENVEMLCRFVTVLGQKFASNSKAGAIDALSAYFARNHGRHGPRVDILIENVQKHIRQCLREAGAAHGSVAPANVFSRMSVSSDAPETAVNADEVLKEHVYGVVPRLREAETAEMRAALAEEIRALLKTHGEAANCKYFGFYIAELLSNYKMAAEMRGLLITELRDVPVDISKSIANVLPEFGFIKMDSPAAPRLFAELLCYLRGEEMLAATDFERYKPQDFLKLSLALLKKWQESGDVRIRRVFTPDEVQAVL